MKSLLFLPPTDDLTETWARSVGLPTSIYDPEFLAAAAFAAD